MPIFLQRGDFEIPALLETLTWTYCLFRLGRKKPQTPPYSLFAIYILLFIKSSLNLRLWILASDNHHDHFDVSNILLFGDTLAIFCMLGLLTTLPLQPYQMPKMKEGERPLSPDDYVTLIEWMAFTWVAGLMGVAQTKTITQDDVWRLSPFFHCRLVFQNFQKLTGNVLLWRVARANSLDLIVGFFLHLGFTCLRYVQPMMMNRILVAIASSTNAAERYRAMQFAVYALLATVLRAETYVLNLWHTRRASIRTRAMIQTAVYYKSLLKKDMSGSVAAKATRDDKNKKTNADTGRILNLMSSDAERVSSSQLMLPILYTAPLELIIATTLLYKLLGWSCFAGLIVMPFASGATKLLGTKNKKLMEVRNSVKDKRMTATNELIQSIRQIKWFGWETQWAEKVLKIRAEELSLLLRYRINTIFLNLVWQIAPAAIAYLTFLSYIKIAGHHLDVATSFTALSLLTMVEAPLFRISQGIVYAINLWTSVKRVQDYLGEDEVPHWVSAFNNVTATSPDKVERIGFERACFKYPHAGKKEKSVDGEEEEERFMLRDLTVDFPIGKLSLIAGATGSGKSSLLLALLGELDCLSGKVHLPKQPFIIDENGHSNCVAFASQTPWLQHASIKDNILFSSPYDEKRYQAVLQACALLPDLEVLEDGDSTEIGEKGVSLSGGQKARVALARAFYSRAQHLLLDDPLSAVDSHTAQHIVSHFCSPLLRGRTILLITHHLELCLPAASNLLKMSEGRIIGQENIKPTQVREPIMSDDKLEPEHGLLEPGPSLAVEFLTTDVPHEIVTVPAKRAPKKLVKDETKAEGSVKLRIYLTYLSAGGWWHWGLLLLLVIVYRFIILGDQIFLKFWSEGYENTQTPTHLVKSGPLHPFAPMLSDRRGDQKLLFPLNFRSPQTSHSHSAPQVKAFHFPPPNESPDAYLLIYLSIKLLATIAGIMMTIIATSATLKSARILFVTALMRVVRSPVRYFDTTQTGRLLSRFSRDFDTVDSKLSSTVRSSITYLAAYIWSIGIIFFVVPPFMIAAVAIGFLYFRLSQFYLRCSREIRRLESNSRSPIYSQFGETLAGVITIRAFSAETRFMENLYDKTDQFQANHYALWMANRYLLWRFDILGACTIFFTSIFALGGGVSAGWAALGISSAIALSDATYWLLRQYGTLELDLNSVERIDELCLLRQEPPGTIDGHRPPAYWPSDKGSLVVEDLTMKYAPDLEPVLKKLSFTVNPKEKVGVVGRTGSGKSTLALSVLRFTDPTEGRIILDGIDISSIGVQDLRQKITLIPQEPALFSGTIRSNLDPFEQHTDAECWEALARVHLVSSESSTGTATPTSGVSVDSISSTTLRDSTASSVATLMSKRMDVNKLSDPVSQGGLNLSAGQRQLMSLARALLRKTNIILMDEATASVDQETDSKIQSTIQTEFSESMVLTIAHRLKTIITYDRILVLSYGEVAEFDTPATLLEKEDGIFYDMCKKSADWELLKEMVRK
ncbi:P-loop containing nucleoside triphosphate hydrolase protein [Atractiella rhizophila]|nr:P-loop containing nucleoside triphosphate hydrolase protein [Atractiella rhizophila]